MLNQPLQIEACRLNPGSHPSVSRERDIARMQDVASLSFYFYLLRLDFGLSTLPNKLTSDEYTTGCYLRSARN